MRWVSKFYNSMVNACYQMLTDLLVSVSCIGLESCGELDMPSLQWRGYSSQKNSVDWYRDKREMHYVDDYIILPYIEDFSHPS